MGLGSLGIVLVIVILALVLAMLILNRYRKCPSDRVMVIYGKVGKNSDGTTRSARCIHGGAAFVVPVIQSYEYLDLTPISIQIDLESALSKQNIRINVPSRFTVGISTEPEIMQNAAERLLGLTLRDIENLAQDIITGQLRLVIATMNIEEINADRDKFLTEVASNVESELKKIGLRLINVNVTDINDESGYIEALGKEAAAKAINDAKISVAEKNRDGDTGEADANQQKRIAVAKANSQAVEGENEASIAIAKSNASRLEAEAEADKRATAAAKVQAARALEEAYAAEKKAEDARAEKERAAQNAEIIVSAEIEKKEAIILAEAEAAKIREKAKGEADAILAKKNAEAAGLKEILMKQAEGLKEVVNAAGGNADNAMKLLLVDKMPELLSIQVEAIKNIKFDKVTVWDSGNGSNGKTSTANFLSGLLGAIPPMDEMFGLAGMKLPEYLGMATKEKETSKEENKSSKEDTSNDVVKNATVDSTGDVEKNYIF